jgi:hypothetical protein
MITLPGRCPKCAAPLKVTDRAQKKCSSCGASLQVDLRKAWLYTIGVCLVLLPLSLAAADAAGEWVFGAKADYADKRFMLFLINGVVILTLYPIARRLAWKSVIGPDV